MGIAHRPAHGSDSIVDLAHSQRDGPYRRFARSVLLVRLGLRSGLRSANARSQVVWRPVHSRERYASPVGRIEYHDGGALVSRPRAAPPRQTLILDISSLPISIGGGIIFVLIGYLPPAKFPLKIRMVVGAIIGMIGTILLVFGQSESCLGVSCSDLQTDSLSE